jgi:hypothetical protein
MRPELLKPDFSGALGPYPRVNAHQAAPPVRMMAPPIEHNLCRGAARTALQRAGHIAQCRIPREQARPRYITSASSWDQQHSLRF